MSRLILRGSSTTDLKSFKATRTSEPSLFKSVCDGQNIQRSRVRPSSQACSSKPLCFSRNEYVIAAKNSHFELPFAPYRHLIWFAIAYGFLLFVSAAAGSYVSEPFVIYPLVSITLSSLILVAIWSVFGPGSYLKRLFWSHLTGLIVAAGLGFGFLTFSWGQSGFDDTDLAFAIALGLIALPPLSLAAQLPFWFFRVFFGWQFVFGDRPPRQSYTLRDIFSVTFLFALSFAIPQIAVNLQKGLYDDFNPRVEWVEVSHPDGSVTFEERERTDQEEISAAQKEHDTNVRFRTLMGFAGSAIYVFLITLFGFPVLLFVFLTKEIPYGCVATAVYGLSLLFCFIMFVAILSGGGALGEGFLHMGFAISCFGAALSIPLSVSRAMGFRLTSPKRYAKQQAKMEFENANAIHSVPE